MKTCRVRNLTIGEGIPKIISPIMAESSADILSQASEMKQYPVDAAEFRADAYEYVRDEARLTDLLKRLRKMLGELPLLFTLRTEEEGGAASFSAEEYDAICRTALASGVPDLIDIQLKKQMPELISEAKMHGMRVILSWHDFHATPSGGVLTDTFREMEQDEADIAKISVMPQAEKDVLTLLNASKAAALDMDIPVIAISMGEKGVLSRVSGEIFGSSMTFASAGTSSAPGQIPADILADLLQGMHHERIANGHIFLIGFMGAGKTSVSKKLGMKIEVSPYAQVNGALGAAFLAAAL